MIRITLNTGRCFTTSCEQPTAEVEEFECLQVSGQPARFGLPAEPSSPHIAYRTYPDYSRCWKCSVLLSGEQMKPSTNFQFLFSFTPENPNSYHEVRANLHTKPILLELLLRCLTCVLSMHSFQSYPVLKCHTRFTVGQVFMYDTYVTSSSVRKAR